MRAKAAAETDRVKTTPDARMRQTRRKGKRTLSLSALNVSKLLAYYFYG
jgi:hypothetical protein